MLYSAETWALTGKLEDHLKSCDWLIDWLFNGTSTQKGQFVKGCDSRMLRYIWEWDKTGFQWRGGKEMWFENDTG